MARMLALAVVVVVASGANAFYNYGTPLMFFPPTFYNAPDYYEPYPYSVSPGTIQAIRIAVDRSLPCPAEGFYTNPSNCSQFYRCVDHAGTGQWFVRYVFECPAGHFFAAEVATCLPGSCDGTQPLVPPKPPVQPVTPIAPITPVQPVTPVQPPQPPQTPEQPTDQSTDEGATTLGPVEDTQPPVQPTDPPKPPVQPTDPSQPPMQPTDPPQPPSPDCIGQYLQHAEFCNAYVRCNETDLRYICPAGTVFDEPRQMCRISAGDESLCAGKNVAAFPYLLRTELVDGHILLPNDFILTPINPSLNPFNPQTLPLHASASPPFQTDLRPPAIPPPIPGSIPANSPSLSLRTQTNPAFSQSPPASPIRGTYPAGSTLSLRAPPKPISSQPGSSPFGPYKSPSQAPFPANSPSLTFTGNQPPFSPFSPLPADTQPLPAFSGIPQQSLSVYSPKPVPAPYNQPIGAPSSINNVRRPIGHLHFPSYSPYNFGFPDYGPFGTGFRR